MTFPRPDEHYEGPTHTLDGAGAADHDQPYRFGWRPSVGAPFPFNTRQFARLLVLRGRYQEELSGGQIGLLRSMIA